LFSKILIANRGEIAVRIIRACREMGISTVAVFSEADRSSLHVSLADESVCIGGARSQDSYLNINAILSAAIHTNSGAIHPGYGLLSENAKFAKLCADCNIKFIGPSGDIIEKMGNKDAARLTMDNAGVPVIPGSSILTDIVTAKREAERIGVPLLIKARSGGGGKGMRLVTKLEDFEYLYYSAVKEAQAAFSDGAVYLEKYLTKVKHIEMQLLADEQGNIVCLGERECSVQRKNQKLLEESPATCITEQMRNKLIEYTTLAAKKVKYFSAGTIEYLLDKDKNFYFMEMNTRIQVEHPVTEMVSGYDLVKWQIRIAAGLPLTFTQNDVNIKGCAIECRINAENPTNNFLPSCGKITLIHIPGGPSVRFDTAVYQDYTIPPYYDSLIGKLIVYAPTREEAIRKMQAALCELVIEGIDHNADLQIAIIEDEDFCSGNYYTDFMNVKKLI
jgi:acetyl-CoA carboxylase biotin carboxylase subunit